MKELLECLKQEVLVCDGAMGTMLMKEGMPEGACPDLWGIEKSKVLFSIHKAYVDSGADIVTTNTFGANSIKLSKFGLEKRGEEINRRSAEIARKACGDKAYLFGDIGPTGEYLKPVGNIESGDMLQAFAEQAKVLVQEGVDAIILETMSDMEELQSAIMAVKENTKLPLIASMTFQRTPAKGFRTTSGISIPQFVNEGLLAGCNVIGANCNLTIAEMTELIAEMKDLSSSFLIAQPNAGMPKLIDDRTVYEQSPDEFAEHIPKLIQQGVKIIGGCCGTTPAHIEKIKQVLNSKS